MQIIELFLAKRLTASSVMLDNSSMPTKLFLASRRKAKGNKMNAAEIRFEKQLEARQNRRMAAEDRFLARIEKREAAAEQMIGELNSGKLYVYPVGGKYREGTRSELIAFLIRNNYA